MNTQDFLDLAKLQKETNKKFLVVNFGCRVNAAEINQMSQILLDSGFAPIKNSSDIPNLIVVNTCSVTKKGDIESLSKIRTLSRQYPNATIIGTGCANLVKIEKLKNFHILDNKIKEEVLSSLNCAYTHQIKDKFSHTNRFILKVQSGCTYFCSYCTVPYKRQYLWSLSINNAIETVKKAYNDGYKEIIITGVNLEQYKYGFSNLIKNILDQTKISLISFGSIPLNCVDKDFIELLKNKKYSDRISHFLHIPLQSGSDKILTLMKRKYDREKIINVFSQLNSISGLEFGTDIIVGFPGESDDDFQNTYDICKQINFKKIHTFRYSVRPNTIAKIYYDKNPKIDRKTLFERSRTIRQLV